MIETVCYTSKKYVIKIAEKICNLCAQCTAQSNFDLVIGWRTLQKFAFSQVRELNSNRTLNIMKTNQLYHRLVINLHHIYTVSYMLFILILCFSYHDVIKRHEKNRPSSDLNKIQLIRFAIQ